MHMLSFKEYFSLVSKNAMMFFVVVDNHWFSRVDETGAYLIDRCGAYVTPIINYLRHGQLVVDDSVNPAGVLEEARFFGITSIIPQLEQLVQVFNHIVRKFVKPLFCGGISL